MTHAKLHVARVGKRKKKELRALREDGTGELSYVVGETISDAMLELGEEAAGKEVVPVILMLEEKPKRRRPKPAQWGLVRFL